MRKQVKGRTGIFSKIGVGKKEADRRRRGEIGGKEVKRLTGGEVKWREKTERKNVKLKA